MVGLRVKVLPRLEHEYTLKQKAPKDISGHF